MENPQILDQLTPAMMTLESDVELPSGLRPSSILSNLIALKKDEVYTHSLELPADKTLAALQEEAADLRYRIRNSVASSIRNAKRVCASMFNLETALVVYPSGRAFVQVAIKCISEDGSPQADDDEV